MDRTEVAVIAIAFVYMILNNGMSYTNVKSKLQAVLPYFKNDDKGSGLINTVSLWKELRSSVSNDETKQLLDQLFPLLVKENK